MPPSSKTVHVYQDTTLKASPSVDQTTGAWDAGSISFSSGDHALKARAEDQAGNFSSYTQKNVRFGDTNVPTTPDLLDDSGESSTDNVTNDDTPRIKGELTLPIPSGAAAVASQSVSKLWLEHSTDNTNWTTLFKEVPAFDGVNKFDHTFQIATALSDGDHYFTVRWEDALSGVSARSASLLVTVDTQAPDVPSITSVADGQIFIGTSIPVSGSAT